MKRYHFLLIGLIFAVILAVVLIVSNGTKLETSLGVNHSPSETESLLNSNNPAIASANAQTNAAIPAISESDYALGDATKAMAQMVVYEDFTNPYSRSYYEILTQVQKEFGDQLALYVRPYFEADNDLALLAQTAAVCAGEQQKFLEMRSWLMTQDLLSEMTMVDGAKEIGLNESKFSTCLNNSEVQGKISRSVEAVRGNVVYGAPTSFLNGEIIIGARAMEETTSSAGEKLEGLKSIVNRNIIKK